MLTDVTFLPHDILQGKIIMAVKITMTTITGEHKPLVINVTDIEAKLIQIALRRLREQANDDNSFIRGVEDKLIKVLDMANSTNEKETILCPPNSILQ